MDAVVVSAANATLSDFCLVVMLRVNLNVSMLVGALGSMRVEGPEQRNTNTPHSRFESLVDDPNQVLVLRNYI
jgi:hypothetical protein